jgi:hypothetical protein
MSATETALVFTRPLVVLGNLLETLKTAEQRLPRGNVRAVCMAAQLQAATTELKSQMEEMRLGLSNGLPPSQAKRRVALRECRAAARVARAAGEHVRTYVRRARFYGRQPVLWKPTMLFERQLNDLSRLCAELDVAVGRESSQAEVSR